MSALQFDRIIIGAGLYGLYSALFCCKKGQKVIVLECDDAPFKRATYINQARVHQGYHYPRSISTALKSAGYFERFNKDYAFCVNKEFDQIYATSSQYSWSDGKQFKAFCKAAASKLEFETPSNLRTVKAFALTQMQNLEGTLVLPEGVETIEHDGIGGTAMPTHKVVLPSTLTGLGLSAIVLTAADTLEFLGDVPPVCTTAASGDAVNPWTSAAGETAKDIVVIVPDGKRAAYMAQTGLGDWFTNIREKSDNTTATVQATADGMQSRSGVWSLTGVYIGSASVAASLPHGVYVINGRKTIK